MAETKEYQPTMSDFNLSYITHNQGLLILLILFCSCFLLIACFVLHLVSRFSHMANSTRRAAAAAAATTTFNPSDHAVQVGLDSGSINRMAVVSHGSLGISSLEERECSICLGLFEDDEMVKVLPECLHAYHSDCVDKWLRTRSSCPLCRSSIDSTTSSISVD